MNIQRLNFVQARGWAVRALPTAIIFSLLAPALVLAQVPGISASVDQVAQNPTVTAAAAVQQDKKNEKEGDHKSNQRLTVTTLGTVNVTATGRVQQVVAVPYNISVVTGSTIEQDHILDNAELLRSIPGVNFVDSGPRNASVVNNVRIRGINSDSTLVGDYPTQAVAPVATYVDSVPLFANFLLFDINRVEVLKGPQGTLYGSGSLGGTVRYILNKPQLNSFGGSISYSLSNVDGSDGIGRSGSVVLNLPVGHTVAIRFDGMRNDFPGVTDYVNLYKLGSNGVPVAPDGILSPAAEYYDKKNADTVMQNYGRVSMLWKPNDSFNLQLSYTDQADRIGARRGTSPDTNGYGIPYERNQLGAVLLEPSNRHVHLTSLEAGLDLGFATLTSSTSNYNNKGDIFTDNTGFFAGNGFFSSIFYNYPRPAVSAPRNYGDKAFTQELRLTSKTDGPFDYIAGLYYHNEDSLITQEEYVLGFKDWWDAAYPAFSSAVISDHTFHYIYTSHYNEVALYGQGTWHATDSLQFTLGMRSFRDKFEASVDQFTGNFVSNRSSSLSNDDQRTSKTLGYGNMSWWLNDSNQLYSTISQGYRRGGANGTPIDGFFAESRGWQFYKSDTVLNYETGLKGILGSLTYTADVYYTKWKNPQFDTNTTFWGFLAVQNVGRAVVKGAELELHGKLGSQFTYGLGYAYTDAYFAENAFTPDQVPIMFISKGSRLPGVSKNHFNLSGSYLIPMWGGLVVLHADGSYQSPTQNSVGSNPTFAFPLGGFTIWNAAASYTMRDWTAAVWIKNLTNTAGVTGKISTAYMGTSPAQNFFGSDARLFTALPRTLGVTLTYRF